MTCSPAQLAANRKNASLSTGPRTAEGKARSRANALKHGLCASEVCPEDEAAIEARSAELFWALKPQNEYQGWIVDKLAVIGLRIDRIERMERRLRDRRSLIAEIAWDDDRRLAIEQLGGQIHKRPTETVQELRNSAVGCTWLIRRWALLAHAADTLPWTPRQTALAHDLLCTPPDFREGRTPGASLDEHGRAIEGEDNRAAMARRQIDELIAHRAEAFGVDEVDRCLTQADLFDESHPELKRLRRYEGTLMSRMRWYLSEMRYVSPHFKPCPELVLQRISSTKEQPAEAAPPANPAIQPQLAGHAPWDVIPPHPAIQPEPGPPKPAPASPTRREKKEKKAESRRESRRRKLDKLRA